MLSKHDIYRTENDYIIITAIVRTLHRIFLCCWKKTVATVHSQARAVLRRSHMRDKEKQKNNGKIMQFVVLQCVPTAAIIQLLWKFVLYKHAQNLYGS